MSTFESGPLGKARALPTECYGQDGRFWKSCWAMEAWGSCCQAAPSWEKPPHLHPFENFVCQVPLEKPPQSRLQGIFPPLKPAQNHFIFDHVASYADLKPDPVISSLLTGPLSSVLACTPGMLDIH